MGTKKATVIRYPWDRWFVRGEFTARRGKDFKCKPHSMAIQIRTEAAKRGLKVSVYIEDKSVKAKVRKDDADDAKVD